MSNWSNLWISEIFQIFSEIFQNFSEIFQNFWKNSEIFLKNFWNISEKSLKSRKLPSIPTKNLCIFPFFKVKTIQNPVILLKFMRKCCVRSPGYMWVTSQTFGFQKYFRLFSEIFQTFFRNISEIVKTRVVDSEIYIRNISEISHK